MRRPSTPLPTLLRLETCSASVPVEGRTDLGRCPVVETSDRMDRGLVRLCIHRSQIFLHGNATVTMMQFLGQTLNGSARSGEAGYRRPHALAPHTQNRWILADKIQRFRIQLSYYPMTPRSGHTGRVCMARRIAKARPPMHETMAQGRWKTAPMVDVYSPVKEVGSTAKWLV